MSEYRLRTEAHLNPHLFDVGIVEEPIRKGYGEGLLLAGKENEHVVALCADLKESTKTDLFAKEYPQRFIDGHWRAEHGRSCFWHGCHGEDSLHDLLRHV